MSLNTLQWAVTGYSLVGAAVIITAGSLGDVFGRKRIFQLGLLLFVVSCVMIALADSGGMVIAGRLIQGAAGATILACGLSLLSVATTGDANLRAARSGAPRPPRRESVGPLLGGVLVGTTGWQGLFWIDAAVAVLCMLLTFTAVSESRDPECTALDRLRRHRPDRDDADATDPGRQQERRLGLVLHGDHRVLRHRDRGRVRFRDCRAQDSGPPARPGSAPQPDPGGGDARNPDRRRHHQRTHVPAQPVLPGPGQPGILPPRGRPGDAAGHRRTRCWSPRWCPSWRRSSVADRSSALVS